MCFDLVFSTLIFNAEEGGCKIMATKLFTKCILLFFILTIVACGGLRYSQLDPAAKDFHPQSIAIFPAVDVGTYEEAKSDVEQIAAGVLIEKKWFANVTDAASFGKQIQANEELRKAMTDYLAKLRSLNFSDPDLSRKIGELAKVDAFLLLSVDSWNYTIENKDKVAKVSIGMKFIEASSGKIMWKAGQHKSDSYLLIKPALPDVARSVIRDMVGYLPH
jgi:hypothetical protein